MNDADYGWSKMTIGELSLQTGVPASTLRYWERIQLLPHAERVSGQRRYDPDAVHLIAALRLAKACGFSLIEMRRLVDGFRPASERWQTAIGARMQALQQQIAQLNDVQRLLERVQRCQCIDLSECGRRAPSMLPETSASPAP